MRALLIQLMLINSIITTHFSLYAQTSSISNGNWSNGSNWSSGVPEKDESVTITNNMDLDTDLEVDDGGNFVINNGAITDDGGGYNLIIQGSGILDVGGNVTMNGDLNLKNKGKLTIRSGDTLEILGSATIENNSDLIIESEGVLLIDGDLEVKNNTVGVVDGKIVVKGDVNGSNNASFSGDGRIDVDGEVDLNNSSSLFGSSSGCSPGPCQYGSPTVLPIELIEFKAEFINASSVEITWTTASEVNNSYFTLEVSSDGRNFHQIQKVNGAGNSRRKLNYSFIHHINSDTRLIYYRLTQVDYDGRSKIFAPIVAKYHQIISDLAEVKLFPNPSNGNKLFLETNNFPRGKYQVNVLDEKGVMIISSSFLLDNVLPEKRIELFKGEQLNKGLYIVQIIGSQESFYKKLLIQ